MTAVRAYDDIVKPIYLFNYLMSKYIEIETYRKTDIGTILDSLNVKGIRKLLIVIPPKKVQEEYEAFAKPMRQLIDVGAAT